MKKFVFPVLILFMVFLSLSFVSSLQIEMNSNYSLGENVVAKVSGTFYTPLIKSNIYFYRGWSDTSFDPYNLNKIDGNYYISFSVPFEKIPGEYSIQLKGIKYYSGGVLSEENVTQNFSILDKKVFVEISPSFSMPDDYTYNLTLTNIETKKINIEYGLEGTAQKSVSLNDGEKKDVTVKVFGGSTLEKVLFTYNGETYPAFVYSSLDQIPIENQTYIDETGNKTNNTTYGNETNDTRSWWDIFWGIEEPKNNSINNETNGTQKNITILNESDNSEDKNQLDVCQENSFPICSGTTECDGTLVDGQAGQCCDGTCIEKETPSSTWKTFGWILIGIVAIFLIWFFKVKFSRTRMSPGGLFRK